MVKQIVYGVERDLDIPVDIAPTQDEQRGWDEILKGSQHGWFDSCHGGAKLHYRKWLPPDGVKPKAVIVFMHGILGHVQNAWEIEYPKDHDDNDDDGKKKTTKPTKRKLNVALMSETFLSRGYALFGFDMYGHGFSDGTRWWIPNSYETNKTDYINFVNKVVMKEFECGNAGEAPPPPPLFLMGESYGGCLTLHVAKHFQDHPDDAPATFKGCVLICPAIIGDLPPYPVYALLRYALAPLFPLRTPFFMPNTLPPERIWRDPFVLRAHAGRESGSMLAGGGNKFRLGTALGLVIALEECRAFLPDFNVPFCVAHGVKDEGVPIAGSDLLWEQCKTPQEQRDFLRLPDAYHDLLGDPDAEQVIEFCAKWIDKRLTA